MKRDVVRLGCGGHTVHKHVRLAAIRPSVEVKALTLKIYKFATTTN
jgi:hypothetical protein